MSPKEGGTFFEDVALPWILKAEGGLVDDPQDPGGRTNLGVTQKTLDTWRLSHPDAPRVVDDLTATNVAPIYLASYWQAGGCDGLPHGLALIHFDSCVNCGVKRSLGFLNLAKQSSDSREAYLNIRRGYYTSLVNEHPALGKFLRGWLKRLDELAIVARTAANLL
jgi:glycosyl hydrolase family 108